jgi:hypothetical protein
MRHAAVPSEPIAFSYNGPFYALVRKVILGTGGGGGRQAWERERDPFINEAGSCLG